MAVVELVLIFFAFIGAGIWKQYKQAKYDAWYKAKKFDYARELELECINDRDHAEFERLAGRPVEKKNPDDVDRAIKEISIKEGWYFYSGVDRRRAYQTQCRKEGKRVPTDYWVEVGRSGYTYRDDPGDGK